MDAESLAQIERIVATAISKETASLRQEFDEGLNEKFEEAMRHSDEKSEEAMRHSDEKFEKAMRHSDEKFEEARRHSGVLHEDVLHRIDLVVEGHQGLQQGLEAVRRRVEQLDAKVEHESLETRALIQLSYRQLHDRVETLEQKVILIEKRLGLAN